ncbi:MAG: signal peptidase II [Lachnospiraceae bacterium]|nr:signal peptidase II [Lachnospiraceae bacterium]
MQYLAVILGVFGLELKIKNDIEKKLTECAEKKACGGLLLIRRHHNRGAFLNAGQSKQKVIAGISVLLTVSATLLFAITLGNAGKGLMKWGLTLLLGGAYSNTYDRIVRRYVVDYVSFNVPLPWLRRIIFNIGDFCIMIGAALATVGYYGK